MVSKPFFQQREAFEARGASTFSSLVLRLRGALQGGRLATAGCLVRRTDLEASCREEGREEGRERSYATRGRSQLAFAAGCSQPKQGSPPLPSRRSFAQSIEPRKARKARERRSRNTQAATSSRLDRPLSAPALLLPPSSLAPLSLTLSSPQSFADILLLTTTTITPCATLLSLSIYPIAPPAHRATQHRAHHHHHHATPRIAASSSSLTAWSSPPLPST